MPDDPRYPQSPPLTARGLVSGYDPAMLPSLPQRVLPRMTFAMVNGQLVPTEDGPETPDAPDSSQPSPAAPAPLATSREDVDPTQLGALLAHLAHASPKHTFTPPEQSSQPVLSPAAASLVPPRAAAVSHAQVPVAHIGAPVAGERFVPPTFPQIMTSDQPLLGVAEASGLFGAARPRAVQSADPYGIQAWMKGAGPPPLMMGTTENVGESALGRGLYSRVDAGLARIPEQGAHPNRVLSLLKGGEGVSQEELAYRKVPEFLAAKGNQPVTRAELQAHLAANPAPMPTTTVLGGPNPARPQTLPEGYRIEHMGPSRFGGDLFTLIGPDGTGQVVHADNAVEAHQEALTILSRGISPTLPTKYQSYSLPGGEAYREHLLQLPNTPDAALQALTDRRDAIRESIAAIDVPIQEHTLPTDPAQVKQWFDEQVAHRRALMEEHSALNDQIDAHKQRQPPRTDYREGHYGGDYPNLLAHVRTTERNLPAAPMRTVREIEPIIQEAVGARSPDALASGAPGVAVRRGLITPEEAQLYSSHRGFYNGPAGEVSSAPPTGPRGRFLEEVQSDWHQTGKRSGYQTPPGPEQQARVAELTAQLEQHNAETQQLQNQLDANRNTFLDRQNNETRALLPPEHAHLTNFDQALREGPAATEAWRAARTTSNQRSSALQDMRQAEAVLQGQMGDHLARGNAIAAERSRLLSPQGVPNAPFKDTWPDLALKQQLLDVARDPHANWLGFTGGQTQANRYDLSKQVSQLSFEPHAPGDYSMGDLVALDHDGSEVIRQRVSPEELDDHIGKEPAAALRERIADRQRAEEWDRSQWSIEPHESGNGFVIHDPNGELVHRYGGDVDWYPNHQEAQRYIDEAVHESTRESPPLISGLDLQVGGEGMTHFYDKLLPARLRKLVKPFGGTVEPFQLPAGTKTVPGEVTRYRVIDPRGQWALPSYNNFGTEEEARRVASFLEGASDPFLRIEPHQVPHDVEVPNTEPSWITRLTPEMKREILRRGFPLLTLPLAAGAASLASRPGADVGQPPPVQPPPR